MQKIEKGFAQLLVSNGSVKYVMNDLLTHHRKRSTKVKSDQVKFKSLLKGFWHIATMFYL